MKYVLDVIYDGSWQECTNDKCPAQWRGGPYDEPWRTCPICFHAVRTVEPAGVEGILSSLPS